MSKTATNLVAQDNQAFVMGLHLSAAPDPLGEQIFNIITFRNFAL